MIPAIFEPYGFNKSRLLALMKERNVDAILLSTPENVFYTTGYPCTPSAGNPILYALKNQFPLFCFIEADGRVTLCVWIGAVLHGVQYAADHIEMYIDKKGGIETLKNFFVGRDLDGKTIGVESGCPYFAVRLIEDNTTPGGLVVIDDIMQSLRLIKSPREVEMILQCTKIAEATFSELAGIIKPGITRPDLIQEAKYRMIKNGATGIGHVTISFGTSNPEVSIEEKLETDKLVAIDIGPVFNGYAADIRRHVYTGAVPERLARLYSTMCGIVKEIGRLSVPGTTAKELHERALKLYEENDLPPYIINVGHSIGLQTEEVWLYNGTDLTLKPGMVINIELYTSYDEGVEIGDEETYLITENETMQLTSLPLDIITV
ncbi:MAG: aminopeptidase P family protein [Deltaproteobacteria bacterium]|nr:aminopeptidase P family protein [Candidatus Zymogenaceae bacterium]